MPYSVLHVVPVINAGGAENHLKHLITGMDRDRFETSIAYFASQGSVSYLDYYESIGVRCHNLARHASDKYTGLPIIWRLAQLIRQERYDLIHCHLFRAELYGTAAGLLAGAPLIIGSKHNDESFLQHPVYAQLHRLLSRAQRKIVVLSDWVEDYTRKVGVDDPETIRRIYYGVPFGGPTEEMGQRVRAEFGLDPDTPLIGTVARLTEQKGLTYLLKATQQLKTRWPDLKLLIAGVGELEHALKSEAESLGITDRVIFAGFRKDAPALMSALDVFVLPSLWEGFGLVLLEAMAARTPVVASAVSAIPEVVKDGETGLLVPPRDPEALASAIHRLLEDPALAERMVMAGLERVRTEFSIERMVGQMSELYEGLLVAREPVHG